MQATMRLCLLLLFIVPLIGLGQTFRYTQYTTHEGLPIDNVNAAAQDEQGFIWLATDFGITRFDGFTFTNYFKANGLINNTVNDIVYAGGDSLIFLSFPYALQAIHTDGRVNTISANAGTVVQQITKVNNQYYYYNRGDSAFGMVENGQTKIYNVSSFLQTKGAILNAIIKLPDSQLGFCTTKGLIVKVDNKLTQYLPNQDVAYIICKPDNTMVAVSNNYVVEGDAKFNFKQTKLTLPNNYKVLHMAVDPDGSVWMRGNDKGIYKLNNNQLLEVSDRLGLQNKIINKFFVDVEQNMWLCTDGGGLLFKKKSAFINYETKDGLINNKVRHLFLHNSHLYIGTYNGLSIKKGNTITDIKLPSPNTGFKYVYKLMAVADADVGICIANVLPLRKDSTLASSDYKYYSTNNIKLKIFSGTFAWEQGLNNYWIIRRYDILNIINKSIFQKYFIAVSEAWRTYTIQKYNHTIYMGNSKGLYILKNDIATKINYAGYPKTSTVFQLFVSSKNILWLATEDGIYTYNNSQYKKINTGSIIGSNYCKSITEDGEGKIWCATWNGLYQINKQVITNYNTTDGLGSKTCNVVLFDSTTNLLYVGTDNGLSVINKKNIQAIYTFNKLYISCLLHDSIRINNGALLATNELDLKFYFNIPYYQGHTDLIFEYKLDSAAWSQSNTPLVLLSDIGTGKHNLYVRAKKNGKLFTKAEAVFTFKIKAPLYKNGWLLLLAVVSFQLFLYWLTNLFTKKSKDKKLREVQNQAEVASLKQQSFTSLMNPHFIFNALNSVQHYVNQQDRQSANKYLSDFAILIRKNFDAAQQSFISLEEELETLRLYLALEKMRFADKFEYQITISKDAEDDEWMLPCMVLQPFLENAILHGLMPLTHKGLITIEASIHENTLQIILTDNGVGIEKSKEYRTNKKHHSKGMALIKERLILLSKLGDEPIQCIIEPLYPNAENKGTKITLTFPQSIYNEYQRQPNKH